MARKFIGERVHVHLPPDMIERIAALVPSHGRARFIREAVQAELDRRESAERAASIKVDPAALYAALAARKASRTDT